MERIILNSTLAVVSNRPGRIALMSYLGAMHALVFFSMYWVAHNDSVGCDPTLDTSSQFAS